MGARGAGRGPRPLLSWAPEPSPGRRYRGRACLAALERPRSARRDFARGVGAAGRLHWRGRAAAARRDPDHRGVAVGGARAQGFERVDGGDPQRVLRRLRDRAVARRSARRPVRRAPPGAVRPGGVRRRRGRRGARVEHRRADRHPRRAGRGRRARQPGGARRRGQRLSARAPRKRTRDLGRVGRRLEPARTAARRAADGGARVAGQLVGARAAGADRGGGHRPVRAAVVTARRAGSRGTRSTASCSPPRSSPRSRSR